MPALVKNGVVESQTAQIAVAGYEVGGSDYSAGGRKTSSTHNGWVFNINENGKFIADVLTRPIELDAVDKITLDISPTIPYGDYTVCAGVFGIINGREHKLHMAGQLRRNDQNSCRNRGYEHRYNGRKKPERHRVYRRIGGYIGQRRNIGLVINNITLS